MLHRCCLLISLLWLSVAAAAPTTLPGVAIQRDLPYIKPTDHIRTLDLYLPQMPPPHPRPLLVWFHGGGWIGGSKADMPGIEYLYADYAMASVEYRFSDVAKFPAQIQDCQAAIRWLRAHAAEYHFDADHIGVWGGSAGGHLVALLGTTGGKNIFPRIGGNDDQSDGVQAVIDLFGPTDLASFIQQTRADPRAKNIFTFDGTDLLSRLLGVRVNTDPARDAAASPIHYVTPGLPPFLILHGQLDNLVPFAQSEEFQAALKKANVPVMLQPFPNAGHGGPDFLKPETMRLMRSFFDYALKGAGEMPKPLPDQ